MPGNGDLPALNTVPATAALVIDQAGDISAIPLTVSREVTPAWYLGIPALVGGAMALALLVLSLLCVRVYRYGNRASPLTSDFWRRSAGGRAITFPAWISTPGGARITVV